jgi:hypothetical protein
VRESARSKGDGEAGARDAARGQVFIEALGGDEVGIVEDLAEASLSIRPRRGRSKRAPAEGGETQDEGASDALRIGGVDEHQGADPLGRLRRQHRGDGTSQAVPDDRGRSDAESVHGASDHFRQDREAQVGRLVGFAEAWKIERHYGACPGRPG